MISPLDETIVGFGEGRIAKNTWVENRIDSVQPARDHIRLAATVVIRPSRRRSGAEKAQGDGDCKHDESLLSVHGDFLLGPVLAIAVSVRLTETNIETNSLTLQKCIPSQTAVVQRDQEGDRGIQGPGKSAQQADRAAAGLIAIK
jgi:hypothetical protein